MKWTSLWTQLKTYQINLEMIFNNWKKQVNLCCWCHGHLEWGTKLCKTWFENDEMNSDDIISNDDTDDGLKWEFKIFASLINFDNFFLNDNGMMNKVGI